MKLVAFLIGLFGFVIACCGLVAIDRNAGVLIIAVGVGMMGASVVVSWFDQGDPA